MEYVVGSAYRLQAREPGRQHHEDGAGGGGHGPGGDAEVRERLVVEGQLRMVRT